MGQGELYTEKSSLKSTSRNALAIGDHYSLICCLWSRSDFDVGRRLPCGSDGRHPTPPPPPLPSSQAGLRNQA